MLLGRVAAPVTTHRAAVRRLHLHEGMPPLRLDDVDRVDLAVDLTAAGHPTAWARLAPHDLDPTAFATLAGAMIATAPSGTPSTGVGVPTVVVESDDDGQVDAFLDQVGTAWQHPRRPIPIILRSTVSHPTNEADPSSLPSLRRRVADLTSGLNPQTRSLLTVVALFGYCHERFASMEPILTECAALPWWVALHGDWWQIPSPWRPAVTAAAGFGRPVELRVLARMVCELVEDGAGDEAIELCLDAGFPGLASDLLAEAAPALLRAERFRALHRWLHRMPAEEQSRHGELVTQLVAAGCPERGLAPRRWWRRRRARGPPPSHDRRADTARAGGHPLLGAARRRDDRSLTARSLTAACRIVRPLPPDPSSRAGRAAARASGRRHRRAPGRAVAQPQRPVPARPPAAAPRTLA